MTNLIASILQVLLTNEAAQKFIIVFLKKQAAKSKTKLDDKAIEIIEKLLNGEKPN